MLEHVGRHPQLAPTESVNATNPSVSNKHGESTDSIASSGTSKSHHVTPADFPVLPPPVMMFWFGSDETIKIQKVGSHKIEGASAASLELQAGMNQIALNVLDAWSKSIHDQNEMIKRELNSESHKQKEAEKGKLGFEAYLNTLSPDQRNNMIEFNRFSKAANANEGFAVGLDDVISKAKSGDPAYAQLVVPLAGAAITNGINVAVPSVPGTVAVGAVDVKPIKEGVDSVLGQVSSSYSVDLAPMASFFINRAGNFAAIQTFPVAAGANAPKIDYEYARNYAHQILKEVNGSDFNSFAMAIITHSMPQGEQIDPKKRTTLIRLLKVAMLSTGLAFLYKMETSFKGKGGGVTGKEFVDLIKGNIPVKENDPKFALIESIKSLLGPPMSATEKDQVLASISGWVDSSKDLGLIKVSPLFNNLRMDTGSSTVAVAA